MSQKKTDQILANLIGFNGQPGRVNVLEYKTRDHEGRLMRLERAYWKMVGFCAAGSIMGGVLVKLLVG